jgi:hypothetical protein
VPGWVGKAPAGPQLIIRLPNLFVKLAWRIGDKAIQLAPGARVGHQGNLLGQQQLGWHVG